VIAFSALRRLIGVMKVTRTKIPHPSPSASLNVSSWTRGKEAVGVGRNPIAATAAAVRQDDPKK